MALVRPNRHAGLGRDNLEVLNANRYSMFWQWHPSSDGFRELPPSFLARTRLNVPQRLSLTDGGEWYYGAT